MHRKKAERVFDAVAKHFKSLGEEVPAYEWIFHDHTHEGLSPGAWSLACEGYLEYDWPFAITEEQYRGNLQGLPEGVFLEAVSGCVLGIYDDPDYDSMDAAVATAPIDELMGLGFGLDPLRSRRPSSG